MTMTGGPIGSSRGFSIYQIGLLPEREWTRHDH